MSAYGFFAASSCLACDHEMKTERDRKETERRQKGDRKETERRQKVAVSKCDSRGMKSGGHKRTTSGSHSVIQSVSQSVSQSDSQSV